jgi:hypothetical protein
MQSLHKGNDKLIHLFIIHLKNWEKTKKKIELNVVMSQY